MPGVPEKSERSTMVEEAASNMKKKRKRKTKEIPEEVYGPSESGTLVVLCASYAVIFRLYGSWIITRSKTIR